MASPATAPIIDSKKDALLEINACKISHTIIPVAEATPVFVNTIAAISAAATVPPALNPYHPNSNNAAPIATNPKLNGPFSFLTFLSPNT